MAKNVTFSAERSEGYARACEAFPSARRAELNAMRALIRAGHGTDPALELGSGTGFLTRHLQAWGYEVDAIDAVFERPREARLFWKCDLQNGLPGETLREYYELAVSLAAMHHVAEPTTLTLPGILVRQMVKVLKGGGRLVIMDVAPTESRSCERCSQAANTGAFFAQIVDQFTTPFHGGVYLDKWATLSLLYECGFENVTHHDLCCDWRFTSRKEMARFCRTLLGLESLTTSQLLDKLQKLIGWSTAESGSIELHWGLQAFVAEKPI